MSPETAASLKIGDTIAWRGDPDLKKFSHVGIVVKMTAKAAYVRFQTSKATGTRIAFENRNALAKLRKADTVEADSIASILK